MKVGLFALTLLLFVLYVVVSAQSYHSRVTYNTNLRATYSLDGAVLAFARAGTTLQVVGQHNRWLKINRNGREVWMASWVAHTRVEGQQTTPSDIDNCCFVNRQCATDQEWVDGYWAFQRNECPVSVSTTQRASTQPVSSAPANVDNCCFVDRHCQTDQEWLDGYWAYQNNQCGAPHTSTPTGGHAIRIEGSHLFVGLVTEALNALRDGSPRWYSYVNSKLARVIEGATLYGEGLRSSERTYSAPQYGHLIYFDREESVFRFASRLVHYACHQYQHDAGLPYDGYTKVQRELECINMDNAAANEVAPQYPAGSFGSVLGVSHCDGDLTNHPRCRGFNVCERSADRKIISCPEIGLTRISR